MSQAIETEYRGVRFRSRLEARWAVFLDALGIRWIHEPEAYQLSCGGYLPDFWLPDFEQGWFVEVKPSRSREAFNKALTFAVETGLPIWLAGDLPDFRVTYTAGGGENADAAWESRGTVIPMFDAAEAENRFYWEPGFEDAQGYFDPDEIYPGDTYMAAVATVRSHRFWEPQASSAPTPPKGDVISTLRRLAKRSRCQ